VLWSVVVSDVVVYLALLVPVAAAIDAYRQAKAINAGRAA